MFTYLKIQISGQKNNERISYILFPLLKIADRTRTLQIMARAIDRTNTRRCKVGKAAGVGIIDSVMLHTI